MFITGTLGEVDRAEVPPTAMAAAFAVTITDRSWFENIHFEGKMKDGPISKLTIIKTGHRPLNSRRSAMLFLYFVLTKLRWPRWSPPYRTWQNRKWLHAGLSWRQPMVYYTPHTSRHRQSRSYRRCWRTNRQGSQYLRNDGIDNRHECKSAKAASIGIRT